MTRAGGFCAVAVLSVTMAGIGCYESEFPIDADPQADIDEALLGVWRCLDFDAKPTESAFTITIAPAPERRYSGTLQEDGKTPVRYEAHASSVAGDVLFNVRHLPGRAKPWVFLRHRLLSPSLLQLQVLDGDVLKQQASAATLRNAVERLHRKSDTYVDLCICVRAREERRSKK